MGNYEKLVDKGFDIIFGKDKTKLYLILITLFGFILRLVSARNLGLSADDANHAVWGIGILGTGKLDIWPQASAMWYYILDIFYSVFGTSQVASRLATAIFGSCFIILIFLLTKQIFKSKKASLISAFLIAISPFHIKSVLPEMDATVYFLLCFLLCFYLSTWSLKKEKIWFIVLY